MRNKHSSPWWLMIPVLVLLFLLLLPANYYLFVILPRLITFLFTDDISSSLSEGYFKEIVISIIICVLMIGIDIVFTINLIQYIKQRRAIAKEEKRLQEEEQERQEIEEYKNSIQNHLDSLSRTEIGKIDFSNVPYKYLPEEYHWAKQKQEQEERSDVSKRTIKLEDLLQ